MELTKPRDGLQRFVFEHAPVRGEIVHLAATWRAVLERHEFPPALREILGELMAAAALLAATLKFSGRLIMQMQGSGPVTLLVVECGADMTLRATAKWAGNLLPGPLSRMLGAGSLVITIDPQASGKQSYQGIVSLEGESVARVLEGYMARSEQLDTRLWLAADGEHCGGMLLQKLPGAGTQDPDAWNRAVHLGSTISRKELLELPAPDIVRRLYHEEDIRLFDAAPVSFRCSCSAERVADMLRMLGRDEVRAMLEERDLIEVDCEFCNRRYRFDAVDAEQLFAEGVVAPPAGLPH